MRKLYRIHLTACSGEQVNRIENVDRKFFHTGKKLQELLFDVRPVNPAINLIYFLSALDKMSFLNLLLT